MRAALRQLMTHVYHCHLFLLIYWPRNLRTLGKLILSGLVAIMLLNIDLLILLRMQFLLTIILFHRLRNTSPILWMRPSNIGYIIHNPPSYRTPGYLGCRTINLAHLYYMPSALSLHLVCRIQRVCHPVALKLICTRGVNVLY